MNGTRKLLVTTYLVEEMLSAGCAAYFPRDPVKDLKVLDIRMSPTAPNTIEVLICSEAFEGGSNWDDAPVWMPAFARLGSVGGIG